MQSWFRNWFNSPYYHLLYFDRDESEAGAFLDKLIAYLKPPEGAYMLDVACGKGRHSLHLANKGYDVTGIDLSEESIEEALKFESDHLHFYQHDMRLPFRINYYDYALNFFTSFGYFQTQRENDNAIRTIAQSLKPGGTFLMDYLNVPYAEANMVQRSEKDLDGVGFLIEKWHDDTHFYKKITIEDDALQEPIIHTEKVSKFTIGNFTDMFAKQGLQISELFGDYNFSAFTPKNSPRLIMIAQKIRVN